MSRAPKLLTRETIERAMRMTRSNRAAARYLNVSLLHYRKYAKLYKDKDDPNLDLYEKHKNPSGRGIPKFLKNTDKNPDLQRLLNGEIPIDHYDPIKIKQRLIFEGIIEEKCTVCGFKERRVIDMKVPLILNFKDKNKKNYNLKNLEFLCYNCSFLYAADPITEEEARFSEDYRDLDKEDPTWELDEYHIQHLKELGLYDRYKPGDEFISKV